ncbi:tol-pal system protein YbgF [Marinoscillum sp.]|uniref:tol-pal system protein YbgF n=1 Tax=Marinoscillum sp. TaxID=2024838 RepID=UPI003BAB5455
MKKYSLVAIMLMLLIGARGQSDVPKIPIDSNYSLLSNPFIQMEATQAINDMYNFKFERSMSHFKYLKKEYGWHPLPYFLMGLNYWWRILPNFNNEQYDETFYAYMDTSMVLAERLYKDYNRVEGAFFLAATYAFKGRLHSERRDWGRAAAAGKNAMNYLEECRGNGDLSPELLFGDALFNYYAEWVPENYPLLKPIMAIFPDGDKEKGIEQLKIVARNAFYTRTEAQYYLMRISYFEEHDILGSIQLAEYLHQVFPYNAYFHRFYTRLLYQSGKYNDAVKESESIINRIDSAFAGYEYNSGRYASFFIGHISEMRGDLSKAKKYFGLAMEYGEAAEATDMGYYIYSVLHLGRIALREEEEELAKDYFKQVKKLTKRSHGANKEARERLKDL